MRGSAGPGPGRIKQQTDMTLLKKKVRREIERSFDHQGRNVILELEPPNLISFREKGRRRKYTSTTNLLMQLIIQSEKDRDLRTRKGKKRHG